MMQNQQYNQYWSSLASIAQSKLESVEYEALYIDALKSVTVEDVQA